MKAFFYYFLVAVIFFPIGWFANTAYHLPKSSNSPIKSITEVIKPTPLAKYSIPNLAQAYPNIQPVKIEIGKVLKESKNFTSFEFTFSFDPTLSGSKVIKKVSGLINLPAGRQVFQKNSIDQQLSGYPVIVMFRGYVDPKEYFIGDGTIHSSEFFANNGFITIAPDFLGYGDSDHEAENIFEARFQTYTTAMTLLASIPKSSFYIYNSPIFIWGHSNGGQIALTTLEITGASYPTVLWAPVSKPFPYSILYYTDDASDSGKFLRHETAEFENNYDSDLYSLTKYLNLIKAPIQLNQGTGDEAVPIAWSDLLNKNLKEASVSAEFIKYAGADHNLNPKWNEAIINAVEFYEKHIK